MRFVALLGFALSCSGSASESPWPAEPIDLEAGPAGETRRRGNVMDTSKLPDNYTKKKKPKTTAPVPEEDDSTIDTEEAPDIEDEEPAEGEGEGEGEEEGEEEEE